VLVEHGRLRIETKASSSLHDQRARRPRTCSCCVPDDSIAASWQPSDVKGREGILAVTHRKIPLSATEGRSSRAARPASRARTGDLVNGRRFNAAVQSRRSSSMADSSSQGKGAHGRRAALDDHQREEKRITAITIRVTAGWPSCCRTGSDTTRSRSSSAAWRSPDDDGMPIDGAQLLARTTAIRSASCAAAIGGRDSARRIRTGAGTRIERDHDHGARWCASGHERLDGSLTSARRKSRSLGREISRRTRNTRGTRRSRSTNEVNQRFVTDAYARAQNDS